MKDHIQREFVNRLTEIGYQYGQHQCLRELISQEVSRTLEEAAVYNQMQQNKKKSPVSWGYKR